MPDVSVASDSDDDGSEAGDKVAELTGANKSKKVPNRPKAAYIQPTADVSRMMSERSRCMFDEYVKQGKDEELPIEVLVEVSYDPFASSNMSVSAQRRVAEIQNNPDFQKMVLQQVFKIDPDVVLCGKYSLGKKLGEGGFGAAYLAAENPNLVVKVESSQQRSQASFETEMKVQKEAAALGYVCKIVDWEAAMHRQYTPQENEEVKMTKVYVVIMEKLD